MFRLFRFLRKGQKGSKSYVPNGMNGPHRQPRIRDPYPSPTTKSFGMSLTSRDSWRRRANSMLSISLLKKAQQIEELAKLIAKSREWLIEHLLCFHGKPRERKICGKENFFHLFIIDFPLQAEESCVSLKTSKRRGTFQGITERGT